MFLGTCLAETPVCGWATSAQTRPHTHSDRSLNKPALQNHPCQHCSRATSTKRASALRMLASASIHLSSLHQPCSSCCLPGLCHAMQLWTVGPEDLCEPRGSKGKPGLACLLCHCFLSYLVCFVFLFSSSYSLSAFVLSIIVLSIFFVSSCLITILFHHFCMVLFSSGFWYFSVSYLLLYFLFFFLNFYHYIFSSSFFASSFLLICVLGQSSACIEKLWIFPAPPSLARDGRHDFKQRRIPVGVHGDGMAISQVARTGSKSVLAAGCYCFTVAVRGGIGRMSLRHGLNHPSAKIPFAGCALLPTLRRLVSTHGAGVDGSIIAHF